MCSSDLRHTNVFGPHDKFDLERSHVVGATITKAMTSKDGKLVVWGDGSEARDLVYVDDLVRFVELAMRKQAEPYEMVHVSAGRAIPVRDLVTRIAEASGKPLSIEYDLDKPTIKTSFSLDNRRARERFGWQPEVTFEEGVRRTVAWWRRSYADRAP